VSNIAAILLAAGLSRRMGTQKLLLNVKGQPMVRRAAATCQQAGLSPIIAVLGHEAERVQQVLAGLDVTCIRNENFCAGMASSLTAGLAALPADIDGALIALADMPFVTVDDMRALCAAFSPSQGRAICIPTHEGKRGNPVLLGRQCFPALAALSGDQGAKPFIRKNEDIVYEVPVSPGVLMDLDTPEAYAAHGGV
jgi:molybdenum cofactor cytidylyltransferase